MQSYWSYLSSHVCAEFRNCKIISPKTHITRSGITPCCGAANVYSHNALSQRIDTTRVQQLVREDDPLPHTRYQAANDMSVHPRSRVRQRPSASRNANCVTQAYRSCYHNLRRRQRRRPPGSPFLSARPARTAVSKHLALQYQAGHAVVSVPGTSTEDAASAGDAR